MTHHIPVVIEQDEDGTFIVSAPTVPGCHSYGYTIDEAMENITEAVLLCLEDSPPGSIANFIGVRDLQVTL